MSYAQSRHESPDVARLAALGLVADELEALRRQGSVVREVRGRTIVYKLRFRLRGRQRTKYLGTDGERAARIARILQDLQRLRCIRRRLKEAVRESANGLRIAKRRLEPILESAGIRFHGFLPRRRRNARMKGA